MQPFPGVRKAQNEVNRQFQRALEFAKSGDPQRTLEYAKLLSNALVAFAQIKDRAFVAAENRPCF